MPPLNNEQIQELAIADQRVASGAPGAATENDAGEVTNAGDVANLAAAGERIGASNISNIQDIALIGSGQGAPVSEGTEGPRDEYNNNQAEIAAGVANAEDNTESPNAALTRLLGERDLINTNSADDLSAIEAAGKAAGAQFDSAIGQARVDRKNTLASEIVRAGSRGGFESTQQAGIAAIQRTDPTNGEAFVGQGGQLDESRQTLDRNISFLVAKQQQAIAAAKSAERKYIKTGKREDYNDSLNLIKLANDMENDKQSMANEKARLALSQNQDRRQGAKSEFDIVSQIPAGETQTFNGVEYTGIAVEDVEPFFTSATIAGLMKDLPIGETKTIHDPNTGEDIIIEGWKEEGDGNQIYKSENQNTGMITFTTVDKMGNIVGQTQAKGGNTYKPATSSSANKTDRLLSLAEQKAYGMGAGKTLQDAIDANKVPEDKIKDTDMISADVTAIMGKADNKLDTSKYEELRGNVAQNTPQLLKWFDTNYSPETWLNPDDPASAGIIKRWKAQQGTSNVYLIGG